MKPTPMDPSNSPSWQPGTRLVFGIILLVFALGLVMLLRQMIAPLVLAFLLAYLLHPITSRICRKLRVSRGISVLIVYLVLIAVLLALTTGVGVAISSGVVQLASYLGDLSVELPDQIVALGQKTVQIGPWTVDLSTVNLEPFLADVASALQPILSQTGSLLASVAKATASAITSVILVLVLSVYFLLDMGTFDEGFLAWIPPLYRNDVRLILNEITQVWNSFLRGQSILGLVVGTTVALGLTILQLQFSLVLGLISGFMEFVPMFGPLIAAIVGVLVALFQPENWLGVTPLAYSVIILAFYIIVQQVENNVLVPRIIGRSLNMSPLAVLISVLAGGMIAGVLGLLLAAPVAASLRVILGYIYRKTVGFDDWTEVLNPELEDDQFRIPGRFHRLVDRLRESISRQDRRVENETENENEG
ncbi:MAG: AI-2E family transporter [Anaerolineales bacterium]|jgi:predicted PurR-regulated permease PerM